MSIPDSLLERWYSLLTTIPATERPAHPMEAKKKLAHFITARFHGEGAADEARAAFEARFSKREMPTDMPELSLPTEAFATLNDLVVAANFATSKSEARRLIEQGGVKLNGEQHKDPTTPVKLETPFILQVGKLKLAKITAKS